MPTNEDTKQIFDFLSFLESFKRIERFKGQVFWRDYPFPKRYDSTADHTWRMAMMLIVIEQRLSQPIDLVKALKMLLVHDVPEIIAGDASPLGSDGTGRDSHIHNEDRKKARFLEEDAAAKEIFLKLPGDEGEELYHLWREYEALATFESKVVKAIDKFEGKLQAYEYTHGTMFSVHHEFTMKYGEGMFDADPVIRELADLLHEELKNNYVEFKSEVAKSE